MKFPDIKIWKKCPLLCMLLVSGIILTEIAYVKMGMVYGEYRGNFYREPILAAAFQELEGNGVELTEGLSETEDPSLSGNAAEVSGDVETVSGLSEEVPMYEFQTVEDAYFDDALFIGDSRTVGLYDYAHMGDAVFYAETSMTIQKILEAEIVPTLEPEVEGKVKDKISVDEALSKQKFGKIYIMLGINELGRGTTETFFQDYQRVIARIRQLQPEAVIFIESIMRVAGEKSETDPIFNNANINARNVAIATLANQKDIFYIDINEVVSDEAGNLSMEYTFDEVHLKASYYKLWKEFLLQHGIVRN